MPAASVGGTCPFRRLRYSSAGLYYLVQGAYAGGKAAAAGAGASIGNLGGRIKGALIKGK